MPRNLYPLFWSNRKTYTMTKLYSLIAICVLITAIGCKSASKSYQKGDYSAAIERGVKKLQKDPYDYETKDLVQKSYNYSINEHEDQIRILSNSNSDTRFEQIYYEYVAMQKLYETIHDYPAVAAMIKTKDYSESVNTYRDKSAQVHIEKGDRWYSEGTKEAYREAYREYVIAMRYNPDNYDLRKKKDSTYDKALTKVILAQMQNYSGGYGSTNLIQNFERSVVRTLANNLNNDFIKFYSEYEARNKDITADQIMELNLNRISLGQPNDNKSTREVTKEVVVKEIVHKPDSITKQYATVRANIITTKRTLLSQGDLVITVRDNKGRMIWNDRFTGDHKWQAEFSSYTGDERALSDADRALLNQSNNYNPPAENQILDELLSQIQSNLTTRLRGYYSRYQ